MRNRIMSNRNRRTVESTSDLIAEVGDTYRGHCRNFRFKNLIKRDPLSGPKSTVPLRLNSPTVPDNVFRCRYSRISLGGGLKIRTRRPGFACIKIFSQLGMSFHAFRLQNFKDSCQIVIIVNIMGYFPETFYGGTFCASPFVDFDKFSGRSFQLNSNQTDKGVARLGWKYTAYIYVFFFVFILYEKNGMMNQVSPSCKSARCAIKASCYESTKARARRNCVLIFFLIFFGIFNELTYHISQRDLKNIFY